MSQLIYSPLHELDYGTILCWARNDLGEQEEPCTFHIIPAGKKLWNIDESWNIALIFNDNMRNFFLADLCARNISSGLRTSNTNISNKDLSAVA